MGRRTILLIVSILVAAIGTALVFLYVQGADERAAQGAELRQALFAVGQISAGTSAEQANVNGLFEQREVPLSAVPEGTVSSLDELTPTDTAVSLIVPGQAIVGSFFSSAATTGEAEIPEGQLAVAVQLSDPARVAGLLQPSDHVTIFVTTLGGAGQDETAVLLSDVLVLRVGAQTPVVSATPDPNAEQVPLTIITLALSRLDAQKVIFVQGNGQLQLWFGLRGQNPVDDAVDPTNAENLLEEQ